MADGRRSITPQSRDRLSYCKNFAIVTNTENRRMLPHHCRPPKSRSRNAAQNRCQWFKKFANISPTRNNNSKSREYTRKYFLTKVQRNLRTVCRDRQHNAETLRLRIYSRGNWCFVCFGVYMYYTTPGTKRHISRRPIGHFGQVYSNMRDYRRLAYTSR